MAKECTKCIHNAVCKTAESCDGCVSGCKHFKGWISVKERLPEEMDKVFAVVSGVRITAVLKGGVWLSSWNHDIVNDEVTHWMPLPEAPKGE